jgi:hypothetical protein
MPRPGLIRSRAFRLAEMLGCKNENDETNSKKMVKCLRKVDVKRFTAALPEFYVTCLRYNLEKL